MSVVRLDVGNDRCGCRRPATCESLVTDARPLCVTLTSVRTARLQRRDQPLPKLGKGLRALPAVAGPVRGNRVSPILKVPAWFTPRIISGMLSAKEAASHGEEQQ